VGAVLGDDDDVVGHLSQLGQNMTGQQDRAPGVGPPDDGPARPEAKLTALTRERIATA